MARFSPVVRFSGRTGSLAANLRSRGSRVFKERAWAARWVRLRAETQIPSPAEWYCGGEWRGQRNRQDGKTKVTTGGIASRLALDNRGANPSISSAHAVGQPRIYTDSFKHANRAPDVLLATPHNCQRQAIVGHPPKQNCLGY